MGSIGRLLAWTKALRGEANVADVQLDLGGDDVVTADNFQPTGEDSQPLPDDRAVTVPVRGSGRRAVVGYADVKNASQSQAGEKRLYSRNAAGEITAVVWLHGDGSVTVANGDGGFELQAGGNLVLNGVTIDTGGNITASSVAAPSIEAGGKELAGHDHDYIDSVGAPPSPVGKQTDPNN